MAKAAPSERALDKIMAQKVLGHLVYIEQHGQVRERLPNGQTRPLRPYSSDISAAWEVANKIGVTLLPTTEGWFALVGKEPTWRSPADFIEYLAKGEFVNSGAAVCEDGANAICLAAFRWVEAREAESEASAEIPPQNPNAPVHELHN